MGSAIGSIVGGILGGVDASLNGGDFAQGMNDGMKSGAAMGALFGFGAGLPGLLAPAATAALTSYGLVEGAAGVGQSFGEGHYVGGIYRASLLGLGLFGATRYGAKTTTDYYQSFYEKNSTRGVFAEMVANEAQANGQTSGAACEIRWGNKVYTGLSAGKPPRATFKLHPRVEAVLQSIPEAEREPWHGYCAEAECVSKMLYDKIDPKGGSCTAVWIKKLGAVGHGTSRTPCKSCKPMLRASGVYFDE